MPTAWSSMTGMVGQLLDKLEELGHRRQHHRHVLHRQRRRDVHLARRRHDACSAARRTPTGRAATACPAAIRWPGVIKPGTVVNDICAHEDMLPTLLAAAGDPNVKDELLKGKQVGDKTFKVHLDGYNLMPALEGEGGLAAQGVHLLDRRRQHRGAPLQRLEDHLPRAARAGPAGLAATLSPCSGRRSHQPADGSLRARRGGKRHGLPALVHGAHVPVAPAGGLCRRTGCRASGTSRRVRSPAVSTSIG